MDPGLPIAAQRRTLVVGALACDRLSRSIERNAEPLPGGASVRPRTAAQRVNRSNTGGDQPYG
jgi:hypothetical protein